MKKYKYFISFVNNEEQHFSGIFNFKFDILEDDLALDTAKDQVSMEQFGEEQEIAFINIMPLTTKNK